MEEKYKIVDIGRDHIELSFKKPARKGDKSNVLITKSFRPHLLEMLRLDILDEEATKVAKKLKKEGKWLD